MKKILALIASPRKLANGEILAKEVLAGAGEDCVMEIIHLADVKLEYCRACYRCLVPDKLCPLEDGLYDLVAKMKAADGVIFAAPDYALGPAAVTKVLADRIIALMQHMDDLWRKPCVVIGTYGVEGWEGYTLSALTGMVQLMGFELKDSCMFYGALPGEVLKLPHSVTRAREMGAALFGEARPVRSGECPTCRSEIWKFIHADKALCPLCGQTADLLVKEEGITWQYGERGTRFEKAYLEEHFQEWLKGKVKEYMERRKELAALRAPYQ